MLQGPGMKAYPQGGSSHYPAERPKVSSTLARTGFWFAAATSVPPLTPVDAATPSRSHTVQQSHSLPCFDP